MRRRGWNSSTTRRTTGPAARSAAPALVMWGRRSHTGRFYGGNLLSIWREAASDVSGGALDTGHYLAGRGAVGPSSKPSSATSRSRIASRPGTLQVSGQVVSVASGLARKILTALRCLPPEGGSHKSEGPGARLSAQARRPDGRPPVIQPPEDFLNSSSGE